MVKEPLTPDFVEAARRALDEAAPDEQGRRPDAVAVVAHHMRLLWEAENVAAESLATVSGDQHERYGQREKAESAWGVAARIRLRRQQIVKSNGGVTL